MHFGTVSQLRRKQRQDLRNAMYSLNCLGEVGLGGRGRGWCEICLYCKRLTY